jgi:hypothetical protein
MRIGEGATLLPDRQKGKKIQDDTEGLARRDGEIDRIVRRRMAVALAVRATAATGLGASPQRLIDDGLDRARATAALGAASEASIDLLGVAGKMLRAFDGTADIMVAKHVAGTDDHLKCRAHR